MLSVLRIVSRSVTCQGFIRRNTTTNTTTNKPTFVRPHIRSTKKLYGNNLTETIPQTNRNNTKEKQWKIQRRQFSSDSSNNNRDGIKNDTLTVNPTCFSKGLLLVVGIGSALSIGTVVILSDEFNKLKREQKKKKHNEYLNTQLRFLEPHIHQFVYDCVSNIGKNNDVKLSNVDSDDETYTLRTNPEDSKKLLLSVYNGKLVGDVLYEGIDKEKNVKIQCMLTVRNNHLCGNTDIILTYLDDQSKNVSVSGYAYYGQFTGFVCYNDYKLRYMKGVLVEDSRTVKN